MNDKLQDIANAVKGFNRILLTGHEQPDGDSIGSVLALGLALQRLGKETLLIDWGTPAKFSFLKGLELFQPFQENWNPDAIIFLDCSDKGRIPQSIEGVSTNKIPIINIDHHVSNTFFGEFNFVDATAAATGEIVYRLINLLGVEIDHDLAACLYVAISTDTGSFRYSNTTELTHRMVADLVSKQVDVGQINTLLFEEMPIEAFKVLQRALNNFGISDDGRLAWVSLTNDLFIKLGSNGEYTEGLINYPRMIKGVEIGILFKEVETGLIKVGFRSKGAVDVNKLAQNFGGGGHAKAAGCKIEGSLDEVIERVLAEAVESLTHVD